MQFRTIGAGMLAALTAFAPMVSAASAQAFDTRAERAYVVDPDTGTILLSKAPDETFSPASLAKLMTAEVVFHAVRQGTIALDDAFPVSVNAWRTGGAPSGTATMFAEVKSSVPVRDLITAMMVQTANDACIVLAEGMAVSEAAFADMMNARAQAIGLTGSRFVNATGLPAEGQRTTARDVAVLSTHLWREYPEFYRLYAEPEFTWNKIRQLNKNPLLRLEIGADGLAAGFAEGEGYAIAASAARDRRRVFAALAGLPSESARVDETRRVVGWALGSFERRQLLAAGEVIGEARLYGGAKRAVPLAPRAPVAVLLPRDNTERLSARIVYDGPLLAPIEKGRQVAVLEVRAGSQVILQAPLETAEAVEAGGLHRRALDAVEELLTGWMR